MPAIARPLALALAVLALTACSQGKQTPEAPSAEAVAAAKAQREAKANEHYALYAQMLASGSPELALPLGEELLKMFPGTEAAGKVAAEIEDLRTRAAGEAETKRLARLWSYQTAPMEGGTQSTASIYSNEITGRGGERARLVLRRHTEWGESAFVYGSEPGFSCGKPCRINITFDDGKPGRFEGSIPKSGEPAIFIEEDKRFVEAMRKAKSVAIELTEKGKEARTLHFDVGGFDPDRFQPLPKKGK